MSMAGKQAEWVWEYCLRHCNDGQMIKDLLKALPFPRENMYLKRMIILRALSMEVSGGEINELTLDLLKGLRHLFKDIALRRERDLAESNEEAQKRRKVSEEESNYCEIEVPEEAKVPAIPGEKDLMETSTGNIDQRRQASEGVRKVDAVTELMGWMKGKPPPSIVVGSRPAEVQTRGCNSNYDVTNTADAEISDKVGELSKGQKFFRASKLAKHWEIELAVMVELAVKYLRGHTPDRTAFENAVTKYWGKSCWDDTGGCGPDVATLRKEIKNELLMVRENLELWDEIRGKFTEARVKEMLKTYLEEAWADTGQTFLDRVSADVRNGNYKPVNCNGQPGKRSGNSPTGGEVDHQGDGKFNTRERPLVRSGRSSWSIEKLQKNFAIGALNDQNVGGSTGFPPGEGVREGEEAMAEEQAGSGSHRVNQQENTTPVDRVFDNHARSQKIDVRVKDGAVARTLEFEQGSGQQVEVGMQQSSEEPRSAQAAAPTDISKCRPASTTPQRNLRRKQRALNAVVEDPLPSILTTRRKGSLLERNPTARTVEVSAFLSLLLH
jgi:hypothetical protein